MLGDNTKGGSKLIEVKHLTKSYDGHPALDDLSFTIEKGRVYGFLGPNGAGKSTTMNIMTGYIGADSGEVLINGFDILKEPEKAKRSVGYLPEIPPLYPDMTVREYLSFVSELKEIPGKERAAQVDEVLSLVRLTDVSSRLIRNLSKGYRQRTGLAAAVLGFPEIIILDEPTVGLDPKQIIEIRQLIRTLSKDHTIILSSHILAEVQEICDYVLIISKGRLTAEGTPKQLEEMSRGKDSVELTIMSDPARIQSVLDSLSGIHTICWKGDTGDSCDISVEFTGDSKKICREISLAFAREEIPVTRIYISRTNLEDIFLELTDTDSQEQEGDEKDESNL